MRVGRDPGNTAGAAGLRARAEALGAALPALVLAAEELAASVAPGLHGRRRPGTGEDFWQYRPAQPGDAARSIDWRRSARGDTAFVREREAQGAERLYLWVDPAPGMDFTDAPPCPTKAARARLLALALAALALRAGERVGLAAPGAEARQGRAHLAALAGGLLAGLPPAPVIETRGRALIVSDFLADPGWLAPALAAAPARGVLLQLLDPVEETFPFAGRMVLHDGALSHETQEAGALRAAYLDRLAARRADLAALAAARGWHLLTHRSDESPAAALAAMQDALG